jgi:hypothetical protein
MAGYLAKAGVACLVLERELFPRPHVGESLVPSSTRVFKDLGFLEEAKFPHKYGAVWTSGVAKTKSTHDWEGALVVNPRPQNYGTVCRRKRSAPIEDVIRRERADRSGATENTCWQMQQRVKLPGQQRVKFPGQSWDNPDCAASSDASTRALGPMVSWLAALRGNASEGSARHGVIRISSALPSRTSVASIWDPFYKGKSITCKPDGRGLAVCNIPKFESEFARPDVSRSSPLRIDAGMRPR